MKCPKCGYIRKPEDPRPDYECPRCGVIYAKYSPAAEEQRKALGAKVRERAARERKGTETSDPSAHLNSAHGAKISARDLICTTCGSIGEYHETRPGSNLVEVVLWLWMIIPGVLYSAWRNSKKSAVCASCSARTLIMAGTPVGRQILQRTSPTLQITDIQPRKPIETAGQKAVSTLSKLVLYFLIFCVVLLSSVLAITLLSR